MDILMMLILPIHEQGINFHLFVTSLISSLSYNSPRSFTCLERWVHHAGCGWCFVELNTWNLYGFVNQHHPNKFNDNILYQSEQQSDSGQQRQPPEGPGLLRALTSAASNGMELFWNQRQPGELGITTDTVIQRSLRWVDLFIFRIWDSQYFLSFSFPPPSCTWKGDQSLLPDSAN